MVLKVRPAPGSAGSALRLEIRGSRRLLQRSSFFILLFSLLAAASFQAFIVLERVEFSTLIRANRQPRTGGTEGRKSAEGPSETSRGCFVNDLIH